jgi:hypothetical protein
MTGPQWARLQTDVNVKLRRGAWYRILRLGAQEAVLEVNRRPLTVSRALLQIAQAPPSRWTVVAAPRNTLRFPTSWGEYYAVCPGCRSRSQLAGHPNILRCTRCNGLFDIAWNEVQPVSA